MGTLLGVLVVSGSLALAAEMPEAPKLSTFAPAPALAKQLEGYVKGLDEAVKSETDYKDAEAKVPKDANTVLLLALALGMHDSDNAYKAAAPGLVEAAKKLMAAQKYAAAKAAVEALQAAMKSQGDPSKLSWKDAEAASLPALMQQVPLVNGKLKRYAKQAKKVDDARGLAAVTAVIAQGSMALADKTQKPNEAAKWFQYCAEMRDACVQVDASLQAKDAKATEAAMESLTKSCDVCHEVFNPKALGK